VGGGECLGGLGGGRAQIRTRKKDLLHFLFPNLRSDDGNMLHSLFSSAGASVVQFAENRRPETRDILFTALRGVPSCRVGGGG